MNEIDNSKLETAEQDSVAPRRAVLKKMSRLALVTAPAVTMLLAAGSKPAAAQIISTPV